MKYFLLTAGAGYYPEAGTGDWVGCYESREEAVALVREVTTEYGPGISDSHYVIHNRKHDWYEIIDLRDWMTK